MNKPVNEANFRIISEDVVLGEGVIIWPFTNLYGCTIGNHTMIGAFVEIQKGAIVGSNCRVQSHSFICEGVTIEDEVFIGHGVIFSNDRYPAICDGPRTPRSEWPSRMEMIRVCTGAVIGNNATLLPGVEVGVKAIVGAGAVVTKNVPPGATVVGNPAFQII